MNVVAMVGDGQRTLGLVPGTDQSWLGLMDDGVQAAFSLRGQTNEVLLLAAPGDWINLFRKAIVEVLNFDEPRQYLPVTTVFQQSCRYLMSDMLWSEKHQMIRFFPGQELFYVFYGIPCAVQSLSYWELLSGEPRVKERVNKILRFILARQIPRGAMKGAMFSQYIDWDFLKAQGPASPIPYYLPDEHLVGTDQSTNRWITSHTMGSTLWSVTQVWQLRGELPEDIKAASRSVADWMVSHMAEDGSWHYAWHPDGRVASPQSDSGKFWNIWALWRYGRLTGETKYSQAADKALAYFKRTFTAAKNYRGYWEDHYIGGGTELHSGQGYEAGVAALAFSEMQDYEAMYQSALDCMMFICTRTMESRTYFTSYGHASENVRCGPGTYIVPIVGRVAQLCYQHGADELYRRFANIIKCCGWWQDEPMSGSFWFVEAFHPTPIEMFQSGKGVDRQWWSWWGSGQKVAYGFPWLVDKIKEMSGGQLALNTNTLSGTDDQGTAVVMKMFQGKVTSESSQVNWIGLQPENNTEQNQLVLMNHAENTTAAITLSNAAASVNARQLDLQSKTQHFKLTAQNEQWHIQLPEHSLVVIKWQKDN